MLQKSSSYDSTIDAAKLRIISDMLVVFPMIFQGCTCLRSASPLARARSAPTEQAVHQFKGVHLSQVHRRSKKCTNLRGALVSSAPTKQCINLRGCTCLKCTNQEVHQFKGVHLSQVHQPRSVPTEYMNAVCFVESVSKLTSRTPRRGKST